MIYVLYRPETDHERAVLEFEKRLAAEKLEYELVSVDTRDGAEKAKVYDIWRYPAVIAAGERATPLQVWVGEIPMLSDVAYYARQ